MTTCQVSWHRQGLSTVIQGRSVTFRPQKDLSGESLEDGVELKGV